MTIPLVVLAFLSVVGGFLGIPETLHGSHLLRNFLDPVFADSSMRTLPTILPHSTEYALMGLTLLTIFVVFVFARSKYITRKEIPSSDLTPISASQKVLQNKYYVDELYQGLIGKPATWLGGVLKDLVEKQVVDGMVNLTGKIVVTGSKYLRLIQTGNVATYLYFMVAGMIALLLYLSFF